PGHHGDDRPQRVARTEAATAAPADSDSESLDREMAFVEKSIEATDLFNERKLPEALAAFEALLRDYGDLDEDGYASMSLADCLFGMGRLSEARAAYQAVMQNHPGLVKMVQHRLRELELLGEPDENFIAELRAAVASETESAYTLQLQLGRALQKRAMGLLSEAMTAFRSAVATEPDLAHPTRRLVTNQIEILAEIQEDLSALLDRLERHWTPIKTLEEIAAANDESAPQIEGYRAEWTAGRSGSSTVHVEVTLDDQGNVKATANHRPIRLNETQSLIIRRHQERINAILLEAMQAEPAETPAQ
ncbi:MAG TPA: tetratricopeptide repeat protein, partial [Phycisphaerae bacterium]|nr:tetratricopeptide repeat protein [Phycisphaerae bacterium]